MPYEIKPTAEIMKIPERFYGVDENEIRFTGFSTCIGIVGKSQELGKVLGVHLSLKSEDGKDIFTVKALPKKLTMILGSCDPVMIIGHTQLWNDSGSSEDVEPQYKMLLELLKKPLQIDLDDGVYGCAIKDNALKIYAKNAYHDPYKL